MIIFKFPERGEFHSLKEINVTVILKLQNKTYLGKLLDRQPVILLTYIETFWLIYVSSKSFFLPIVLKSGAFK